MNTIRINKVGDSYWYQPSIVTTSRRKWQGRPYRNLKKLLQAEELWNQDIVISLNSDKDMHIFNMLQQYKESQISFKKEDLLNIDAGNIKTKSINKVTILFDKKSIKIIKKGYLPFCSQKYLIQNFKKHKYALWRSSGFIIPSDRYIAKNIDSFI